jgi:HEAT repeat protein
LARVEDAKIRGNVAFALGRISQSTVGAVSCLIELLADEDAMNRLRAAHGLEKIGPAAATAVPALEQCLKDESRFVREAAQRAIVAIDATGRS